jgi:spermidine synthase
MSRPWTTIDRIDTAEGPLELRQRGAKDFLIVIAGRILMSSTAFQSEVAVAEVACRPLAHTIAPRVLIGGLGMGLTLRAALDVLPGDAVVTVVELNPEVVRWCRGPLADLTARSLEDPRVSVVVADVSVVIAREAKGLLKRHAIVLDLYEGPHAATQSRDDPFYGVSALRRSRAALVPGGVLSVWSEDPDAAFEQRLSAEGFAVQRAATGRGGRRHAVYLARTPGGR